MPSADACLPPLKPRVATRLRALCGEVDDAVAAIDALGRGCVPFFRHVTSIQHQVVRRHDGSFRIAARDHVPSPDGLSAHEQLALVPYLDTLHTAMGRIDAAFLALAKLLHQHAPGFQAYGHLPALIVDVWEQGDAIRLFLRATEHGARHAVTTPSDRTTYSRSLRPGELERACVLACRARGAGTGAVWTFGANLFQDGHAHIRVAAEDAASALAWIMAAHDHGALEARTGVTSLVRHHTDVSGLAAALSTL